MKLLRPAGVASEIFQIFVADSSSTTGTGLTGLVFNSGSLTAYYHRDTDTTATAITLVTMTVGTFTSSGFKEIDATNMPGWYQFCPPNAALAAGAKSCAFHLKGATNMGPVAIEVQFPNDLFGIMDFGTLQSATATTAVLRAGYSTADSRPNSMTLQIINGTGSGQARVLTGWTNASQTATVDTWTTTPDNTSVYLLYGTAGNSGSVPPAVNVKQWNGATVAVPATAGVVDVNVKNIANVAAALDANNFLKVDTEDWKGATAVAMTGDAFARLGPPTGASVSADILAAPATLLDVAAGVETGLTVRQAFRLFAAALLGKASGLAVNAPVYRDTQDTKNRITATTDANGNRTAVTLDGT